ncbi:MAG: hypothetical protein ACI9IA_000446, partial [Enterobacterales bacterium]
MIDSNTTNTATKTAQLKSQEFEFLPLDNDRLLLVNGEFNDNLRL